MIDNTNLLDRIKSELEAQGGLSCLGSSFRIRKGFRYTDDTDSLIFLPIRDPRRIVNFINVTFTRTYKILTSKDILHIIVDSYYSGVCNSFDYKGHFVQIVMMNDSIFDTKDVHVDPKRLRLRKSVSPFTQNNANRRWL